MRDLHKMLILVGLALAACGVYLFQDLNGSFDYALPRRGVKVFAMVLTGVAIAYATVVFQTITHNRILTPSIMGLDSLYMMLQTLLIFFLGSDHITIMNKQVNFVLSIAAMVVFALLFYHLLFRKNNQPIYFLLLIGIICGTFFGSISTFLQVLIDPNEFQIVQDQMFASFNNVNSDLVWLSVIVIAVLIIFAWRHNSS